jgi:hypothetical protein
MTTFSRATITIATDPPTEVQAMVRGGLAVHGSAGLYTVTHVASGRAICHSDQQRTAKGVAIELLEMDVAWDAANISQWEEDRVLAYLEDLKRNPPQAKAKPLVAPPLELEPIYPDYFTPSERLRKLDGEVAQMLTGYDPGINFPGNPVLDWTIGEASAAEWRELIMVRMGTGKQAKLLDKDIPDKSPPLFPLPPGILPGYAGVKQLTQQMWKLGQAIDELAMRMIDFCTKYIAIDQWDSAYFSAWMVMDDDFSEMVRRGWCDWAVCVNLFTQLTKEEQQKITDVLGFVGSEEQGWHAYGAKTFMRSKRLPELIRCRRAVREALNG